jgi:hypothetical protein
VSAKTATNPSEPTDGLQSEPAKRRAGVSDDRRAVLESIAYGADPKVSPGDRLKALEQLREFERAAPIDDGLSEEQIWAEVDSFFCMMLSAMFIESGVEAIERGELDPARFPQTAQALRSAVGCCAPPSGGSSSAVVEEREAAGYRGEPLNPQPASMRPESGQG